MSSANKGSVTLGVNSNIQVTHYVFSDGKEYLGIKDLAETHPEEVLLSKEEFQQFAKFTTELFG